MKQHFLKDLLRGLLVCAFVTGWAGCGGKDNSPKADVAELERAFNLTAGAPASGEATPAGQAARAVVAIRAQDWAKAVALLDQLRHVRGLTADQMHAVHNASANAFVRLAELASRGSADAQTLLDRMKKEQERR